MTGERLPPPAGKVKPKPKKGKVEAPPELEPEPIPALERMPKIVGPQPDGDGKVFARRVPYAPPEPGQNRFVDNRRVAKNEIAIDQKLTEGVQPTERRPPPQTVTVTCDECNRSEQMSQLDAPVSVGGDQGRYVCVRCVRKYRDG